MITRQLLLVALLAFATSTHAQRAQNPIVWADAPDPDVICVDDTFYMVTTTMHQFPCVPIEWSLDLKHWHHASYVVPRLTDSPRYDLLEGTVYGRGQWATSLKYHDGRFYVLFAPNEGGEMGRTYIYSAAQASGPWTLVSRLPHFHDASLLFDDDGRVYVYYGTGEQVELTSDLQGVVPGSHHQLFEREADETGILEGSRVVKHLGRYYLLMISQVWAPGRYRRQVCYRADRPEGPYEKRIILQADFGGFPHVGQGTIVPAPSGDWYAVIFQDRGAVGRVPLLMPCRWVDGWPMLGDENGEIQQEVPSPVAPKQGGDASSDAGICSSSLTHCTGPIIPPDREGRPTSSAWQWNHNPVDDAWSVTERPGFLRLRTCRVVPNLYLAPNTLSQRMEGPACSASVGLDVSHLRDGDCAGFCAFNGQSPVLCVKRQGRRLLLEMSEQQVNLGDRDKAVESVDEEVVESVALPRGMSRGQLLHLRIDADFRPGADKARFFYSTDGAAWQPIGREYHMRFDWQRLFMGTRYALFCYATRSLGGYVDVGSFSYEVEQQ